MALRDDTAELFSTATWMLRDALWRWWHYTILRRPMVLECISRHDGERRP